MRRIMTFLSLFSMASRIHRGTALMVQRSFGAHAVPSSTRSLSSSVLAKTSLRRPPPPISRSRRIPLGIFLSTTLMGGASLATCQVQDDDNHNDDVLVPPFEEESLAFDHYNGVTIHLDKFSTPPSSDTFQADLEQALTFWKAEGRKGIWIHVPPSMAYLVPHCVKLGFTFHFVKDDTLILSRWLPNASTSRLPLGPTHQIGVGALVLNPEDPTQMLVVQEITGPAAARKLWKMPTGLLDPGEDIPDAAVRELQEETGLKATMDGIVCFRQAHSPARSSDLFFVCRMTLQDAKAKWLAQEEEIADIRWMSVEEYCHQETWQTSPVYQSLNSAIQHASETATRTECHQERSKGMIMHERLPVGLDMHGTNALFKSQL